MLVSIININFTFSKNKKLLCIQKFIQTSLYCDIKFTVFSKNNSKALFGNNNVKWE